MAFVEFKNLHTWFYTDSGIVKAVNGVDFEINEGETVCVVGESGCGKSVTALSMMHLVQTPPGKIVDGQILMDGVDLLKMDKRQMEKINGKDIAMIFQEPMTSLNPVLTVGHQIMESLLFHTDIDKKSARAKALEMLKLVGIPRAEEILDCYPHELSGGMRQRVMIAMALVCNPRLLVADEPTTALDVTIQAQVLDMMRKLKETYGTAMILITHALGVVAEVCSNVAIMYAGEIVEKGTLADIYNNPSHPYTIGLFRSIPDLDEEAERLHVIPGMMPDPANLPDGCNFCDRCPYADDRCQKQPPIVNLSETHQVQCWRLLDGKEGE